MVIRSCVFRAFLYCLGLKIETACPGQFCRAVRLNVVAAQSVVHTQIKLHCIGQSIQITSKFEIIENVGCLRLDFLSFTSM